MFLPEVSKLKEIELRPIALTYAEYKLFWGGIQDLMVEHLVRNGVVKELQQGFTKGKR